MELLYSIIPFPYYSAVVAHETHARDSCANLLCKQHCYAEHPQNTNTAASIGSNLNVR